MLFGKENTTLADKPGTSKSNIKLPTKAKSAGIKANGTLAGSKYGAGQGKKK